MRKTYLAIAIIFVASTAFIRFAEPETDILGKWKIADSYVKNFITYQIETARAKNPEQAEQMEQNIEMISQIIPELVFDYKADHTIELTAPQGTQSATWKLSDDKKTVIVGRPDGTERKDVILELSKDKFKILMGERKDTILLVRK
jgi:hypothetical protein